MPKEDNQKLGECQTTIVKQWKNHYRKKHFFCIYIK